MHGLFPVEMRLAIFVGRCATFAYASIISSMGWCPIGQVSLHASDSIDSNFFRSAYTCLLQESPLDENLPAINVIVTITGKFFQQAEVY